MAKVDGKKFTMQGRDTPVSAAGQGVKAGPQASSSCNRSSSKVGDLASGEFRATRKTHTCVQDPDIFCYVCGNFEVIKYRRKITDTNKELYFDCFHMEIVDEDKPWVPDMICCNCLTMMTRYKNNSNKQELKFLVPTLWKKPKSKLDCYFCKIDVKGFNVKNKCKIKYPNVPSVIRPVASNLKVGMNSASSLMEDKEENMEVDVQTESFMEVESREDEKSNEEEEDEKYSSTSESSDDEDIDGGYPRKQKKASPKLFDQKSLNDFIRRIGVPKDMAEYIAAEFKKRGFLKKGTTSSYYRNREQDFRKYFAISEDQTLVHCTDIQGLMNELKPNIYVPEEWRLFIDSSVRSLKAVLLHNGNTYASIPIAHSTKLKEEYETIKYVLKKIKYEEHNWQICGDLKIITMMLGQQSGYTKYPCFKCLWDSRDRENHYKKKNWELRKNLDVGKHNVKEEPLVNDEQDIKKIFRDNIFINQMTVVEKKAWISFRNVS